VEALFVVRGFAVVAHTAIDRLHVFVVKVGTLEVHVAHDAVDVVMDRRGESLGVDVHGYLEAIASPGEIRVLVTHEAVLVLLGTGGKGNEEGKCREQDNPRRRGATGELAVAAHANIFPGEL
jgi:hypothetical protein